MTESNVPQRWSDPALAQPEHDKDRLEALSLARDLHLMGKTIACRREFARLLAQMPAMKEAWFRRLALELKKNL